jgi:hypothetical protein
MELIKTVRANRINKSQVSFTIPMEIVKKLGIGGGEKYFVFLDEETHKILYQPVEV